MSARMRFERPGRKAGPVREWRPNADGELVEIETGVPFRRKLKPKKAKAARPMPISVRRILLKFPKAERKQYAELWRKLDPARFK